jgi:hypothetical protein
VKLMGSELTLLQHADDAMCYKADVKHAQALVRFIKPKSLRQLTETHRAVLSARLAAHRYKRDPTLTKSSGEVSVLPGAELRPLGKPSELFQTEFETPSPRDKGQFSRETPLIEPLRRKISMVQNGTAYGHRPDAPSGAGVCGFAGKST